MLKRAIITIILAAIYMIAGTYFLDLLFKHLGRNMNQAGPFVIMSFLLNVNCAIIYSVRFSRTDTLISKYLVYFSRGLLVLYQIFVVLLFVFLFISAKEWAIITVFVFLVFIVINFIFRKSKDEMKKMK